MYYRQTVKVGDWDLVKGLNWSPLWSDEEEEDGEQAVREDFTITEKATTKALSWLKAPNSAFTFKTLC